MFSNSFSTRIVAALAVLAVIMTGGMAGAATTTATQDSTAALTATNHAYDINASAAGDLKKVVIDYEQSDVQRVNAADVNVSIAGVDADIASVKNTGTSTMTVTLDTTQAVAATDIVAVETGNNKIINQVGNETVDIELSNSSAVFDNSTLTLTHTAPGAQTARTVGNASEFVDLGTDGFSIAGFDFWTADNFATISDEDVTVNGSDANASTTYFYDGDAADRLEMAAEEKDDGERIKRVPILVTNDDTAVVANLYNEEVPDEVDTETDTYAVYDVANDSVVVEYGESFEDAESMDEVFINTNVGIWKQMDVFGFWSTAGLDFEFPSLF
ncbi:hypothetical protein [Halomarina oriensis]|uniref:Uncharacterized protein n=1 Tax=Halomarina oriensis TaxID=671145 RepID=A0A6B0GRI3_9EURY|nr:hypothetical protein [Halomarina oriensis]MWG36239.1 hypothetical protein [Halomarina oriensis]